MSAYRSNTPDKALPSRAGSLTLIGGALCLNFVNTSSGRGTARRLEHLRRFEHLVAWAHHAKAIDEQAAKALARQAARSPKLAQRTLERAIELRESLHAMFCAAMAGDSPPPRALACFNRTLSQAMAAAAVEATPHGFVLRWPRRNHRPDSILWPIVNSAADLLTRGRLDRVKACPGHYCGWVFLDATRNGKRRWCEMEVCGSRAKMRRYHLRRRAGASADNRP
jgi:predicted RNA-binding Zn ribbon-like protein